VTVLDALRLATAQLSSAGVESAENDAELLLRHLLGWNRARLISDGGEALPADVRARYVTLVDQRARRKPLQHLTGTQAFWKHDFAVSPDVLVPRPDTEVLVEAALELLRPVERPVVVDVGTGSGCIALSLAAERPEAEVHAVDISKPALSVALKNAEELAIDGRVVFHHGDLLAPVASLEGAVDLVVSNPPYVSAGELATLEPEVGQHEPRIALVPPHDRLSIYRRLAPAAAEILRPGGALAVEIGQGMENEVSRVIEEAGLLPGRVLPDLAGTIRVVVAHRAMG
jgi:release factor glutamine methyltransferase